MSRWHPRPAARPLAPRGLVGLTREDGKLRQARDEDTNEIARLLEQHAVSLRAAYARAAHLDDIVGFIFTTDKPHERAAIAEMLGGPPASFGFVSVLPREPVAQMMRGLRPAAVNVNETLQRPAPPGSVFVVVSGKDNAGLLVLGVEELTTSAGGAT